jgi:hypothetical protein
MEVGKFLGRPDVFVPLSYFVGNKTLVVLAQTLCTFSCYVSPSHEDCNRRHAFSTTTMKRPSLFLRPKLSLFVRNTIRTIRSFESERHVSKSENEDRVLISNSLRLEKYRINSFNWNLMYTNILQVRRAIMLWHSSRKIQAL